MTFGEKLDLVAGARVDYENKNADLEDVLSTRRSRRRRRVDAEKSFSNVSPQFAAAYRFNPAGQRLRTVASGFKAGGFNPASPAGSEAYGEEHTWNVEGGPQDALGQRSRGAQQRRLLHRLERPAAQRPEPERARARSTSPTLAAPRARASSSSSPRGPRRPRRLRRLRLHQRAFSSGSTSVGADVSRQQHPEHARLHRQLRRAVRPRAHCSGECLRPRRRGALRRLQVRRQNLAGSGRVLAGELPRRRARQAASSPKGGCATPSTPPTSRSPSPTGRWRHRVSSARTAPRARSV